jgi:hypothetical protein
MALCGGKRAAIFLVNSSADIVREHIKAYTTMNVFSRRVFVDFLFHFIVCSNECSAKSDDVHPLLPLYYELFSFLVPIATQSHSNLGISQHDLDLSMRAKAALLSLLLSPAPPPSPTAPLNVDVKKILCTLMSDYLHSIPSNDFRSFITSNSFLHILNHFFQSSPLSVGVEDALSLLFSSITTTADALFSEPTPLIHPSLQQNHDNSNSVLCETIFHSFPEKACQKGTHATPRENNTNQTLFSTDFPSPLMNHSPENRILICNLLSLVKLASSHPLHFCNTAFFIVNCIEKYCNRIDKKAFELCQIFLSSLILLTRERNKIWCVDISDQNWVNLIHSLFLKLFLIFIRLFITSNHTIESDLTQREHVEVTEIVLLGNELYMEIFGDIPELFQVYLLLFCTSLFIPSLPQDSSLSHSLSFVSTSALLTSTSFPHPQISNLHSMACETISNPEFGLPQNILSNFHPFHDNTPTPIVAILLALYSSTSIRSNSKSLSQFSEPITAHFTDMVATLSRYVFQCTVTPSPNIEKSNCSASLSAELFGVLLNKFVDLIQLRAVQSFGDKGYLSVCDFDSFILDLIVNRIFDKSLTSMVSFFIFHFSFFIFRFSFFIFHFSFFIFHFSFFMFHFSFFIFHFSFFIFHFSFFILFFS